MSYFHPTTFYIQKTRMEEKHFSSCIFVVKTFVKGAPAKAAKRICIKLITKKHPN